MLDRVYELYATDFYSQLLPNFGLKCLKPWELVATKYLVRSAECHPTTLKQQLVLVVFQKFQVGMTNNAGQLLKVLSKLLSFIDISKGSILLHSDEAKQIAKGPQLPVQASQHFIFDHL